MKNPFRRYACYALALSTFILPLSPRNGMGESWGQGTGMEVAKLTPDTPAEKGDLQVFDKHHPEMRKVVGVQNRHARSLMAIAEVVGTASGLTDAGRPAILVFARKEAPPGVIPESLEGVPVVVRVTGEISALKPPAAGPKFSTTAVLTPPVPIGVSTGNTGECSAGTIGARVVSGTTKYALSNNHVLAMENAAPPDSYILQPGPYDTRCATSSSNVLGTLSAFVQILYNNSDCDPLAKPEACNRVDAAIAAIYPTGEGWMLGNATPSNGYGTPNSRTYAQATGGAPYIGQAVQKYGRTTSLTRGAISGINATVTVSYGTGKNAVYIDQIAISSAKPFSKAGDSGSLIVTNDSHAYPVGLLFAGGSGITIANPIDLALESFAVTIDGTAP